MKTGFKKALVFVLVLSIFSSFVFAQGNREAASKTVSGLQLFTDDLNRVVELKKPLEKVAPSGHMATVILLTFDPSMLTGLSRKVDFSYFKEDLSKKPIYGAFYGAKADLNKESVLSSGPQVVIDIGEIKKNEASMKEDLDALSVSLGVPAVFIKSYFEDIGHTYRRLGALLGKEHRGEELAQYADETIAFAKRVRESVKTPKTFYYSTSADGLTSFADGNLHTELFGVIGAKNIIESNIKSGTNAVSLEEIIRKDPDVILLDNEEAYKLVTSPRSAWSGLKAVKNGNVYLVPNNIYSWIDSPPSVNRLLGVYYLADIFYPEIAKVDVKAEAKRYFKLFYNYDLKDSQIKL